MTIKKTLASIALGGALVLGVAGCSNNSSPYTYNGYIGKDQVIFKHVGSGNANILTVKKLDGRTIRYEDYNGNDLKLEYVIVRQGNRQIDYSSKIKTEKSIMELAQKQFNKYLKEIVEIKTEEGKENLGQGLKDLK